ncbi:MAG: amidohydrolase family protein [Burkholderiaceae bacterium]
MSAPYDLKITGATVYDGLGNPGNRADVAVRGGRIAAIGHDLGDAKETVRADGLSLMPGIVDVHTHYDAQITWDARLTPSPALGVTTAILGNCGFGIAPCPTDLRETMMKNLSVVEGMDLNALVSGTRWGFETFPEYLDFVETRRPAINVGVFAGHSAIRTAVMGEQASLRKTPTDDEMARMCEAVREAMRAGAIGFASSFSPNHFGFQGAPMPSTIASDDELRLLVQAMAEDGHGVFMMATGPRATPEFMESMAQATGRPMFASTVLTMYNEAKPEVSADMYARAAAAIARGHEVYLQTTCQPLSFNFTLLDPYLLLSHDAFDRIAGQNETSLRTIYADPAFRARFRENLANPARGILFFGDWAKIETADGTTIAEHAQRQGTEPLDAFFDLALTQGLDTPFVAKLFQNHDAGVAPLLQHPAGVITLSDAGAHLVYFCDAGFGPYLLSHWVRETGTFTLAEAIRRLTSDPADKFRIPDRGRLATGAWADMVLFDPQTIERGELRKVDDLPGGGTRMIREAQGLHGVWVNGTLVHDGRQYTDIASGPGQVIRRYAK